MIHRAPLWPSFRDFFELAWTDLTWLLTSGRVLCCVVALQCSQEAVTPVQELSIPRVVSCRRSSEDTSSSSTASRSGRGFFAGVSRFWLLPHFLCGNWCGWLFCEPWTGCCSRVRRNVADLNIPYIILEKKMTRISDTTERAPKDSPVIGGFSGQVRQATVRKETDVTGPV